MNRTLTAAMAAVLAASAWLAACQLAPTDADAQAAAPVAPVTSLRGSDAATEDLAPAVHAQLGKKPGAQETIVRTFVGQPPLIPHATDNFDEVTLEDNQCLECHGAAYYEKKNAPRISDSHFGSATGEKLSDTDSRRHACQLCHVPQYDAPPLIDNAFVGAMPKKK